MYVYCVLDAVLGAFRALFEDEQVGGRAGESNHNPL